MSASVDFVIGDDRRVAVGIALTLAATAILERAGVDPWWLIIFGVPLVLGWSLWHTTKGNGR